MSLQTTIFELEAQAFQHSSHSKTRKKFLPQKKRSSICRTKLCCRLTVKYDLNANNGADAQAMLAILQAAVFVNRPIYKPITNQFSSCAGQ